MGDEDSVFETDEIHDGDGDGDGDGETEWLCEK